MTTMALKLLTAVASVLVVVVVSLLAVADASSYTFITTVEEESQGSQGQQRPHEQCRQETRPYQQQLQHCGQFLSQGIRPSIFARAMFINQQGQGEQIQHLVQCCSGLWMLKDEQCRCQSIEDVWKQEQQQQQGSGSGSRGSRQSKEQMTKVAGYLPLICSLGHTCDIQTPDV